MIHLIVGAPSPLMDWCAATLAAALRRVSITARAFPMNTLNDLARVALSAGGQRIIGLSTTLDDALADALAGTAHGPAVPLHDPLSALARMLDAGTPALTALRYVMHNCIAAGAAANDPRSLVLTAQGCAEDQAAAVARLTAHFGCPVAPDVAAAIAEECASALEAALVCENPVKAREDIRRLAPDIGLAEAMLEALLPYEGGLFRQTRGRMMLRPAFFHAGTPPHPLLSGPIDATGRAGYLFYGGYVPTPRGDWEARFDFDVSEAATEGLYRVEVVEIRPGAEIMLAHATFTAATPGLHEITLSFRATGHASVLDLRLRQERALFDGSITVGGVELTPRFDQPPARLAG